MKKLIPAFLISFAFANSANAQIITANFDPASSLLSNSMNEINLIELDKKTLEKMTKNYENGYWTVFQGKSGAAIGQYCTAMFTKKDMSVTLHGPGGEYKGALLSFMGLNNSKIPVSESPSKLMVNFKQGNEAPIDINVINTSMALQSDEKIGVISLPVPTIQALMDGMEDNYRFVISYNGQTISDIEWQKGFLAREELKKCLSGNKAEFTTMLK